MITQLKNLMERVVNRQFVIFLLVGLLASAAYLLVMSLGVDRFGFSVLSSAFLGFCAGTGVSFVGNTLLTFRSDLNIFTALRFLAVVLVGMGLNQLIAFALNWAGAHYIFIWLAVFIVIPIINFVGHSTFTYQGSKT